MLAHALHWLSDDDAVQFLADDLSLRCAFGSGLRPAEDVAALLAKAGRQVTSVRDVGWSHRLWQG